MAIPGSKQGLIVVEKVGLNGKKVLQWGEKWIKVEPRGY
jgi:hypothetical protein